MKVDMAFAWKDGVSGTGLVLSELGDLDEEYAFEVIDAANLYIHPETPFLSIDSSGVWLLLDSPAAVTLRKGPVRESELVMRIGGHH